MLAGACVAVVIVELSVSLALAGPRGVAPILRAPADERPAATDPSPELMINASGLALNLRIDSTFTTGLLTAIAVSLFARTAGMHRCGAL